MLTVDALTGEESSAAIKDFAKVGLVPFTKNVLVDDIYGAATAYVDRVKKEGQDGQPVLPKPLALSPALVPNSFPPLQQTWQPSTCRSSSLVRGGSACTEGQSGIAAAHRHDLADSGGRG